MILDFHPEAIAEVHDASHWYEDRSTRAGDGFLREIRTATETILKNPTRYRTVDGLVRVFSLKKYPFRLYYAFDEVAATVCIYAVMHEKRRSDYWRRRLPSL